MWKVTINKYYLLLKSIPTARIFAEIHLFQSTSTDDNWSKGTSLLENIDESASLMSVSEKDSSEIEENERKAFRKSLIIPADIDSEEEDYSKHYNEVEEGYWDSNTIHVKV